MATAKTFTLQQFRGYSNQDIKYFDIHIPYQIIQEQYIIYRKQKWNEFSQLKTFLCMPGTAFVFHNKINYEGSFSLLLDLLPEDYQIILLLHPLAPQHKFPEPIISIQKLINSLIQSYERYLVIPSKTILGGYSSGGSIVPSIAIDFAKKGIIFNATLMISPVFDYSGTLHSNNNLTQKWQHYEVKDHPKMNHSFIQFMNQHYSNSPNELTHPWYSAIFTPDEDLKYLINPHFIYGEYDFMRRSIQQFKNRLSKNGLKEQTNVLLGYGHLIMILVRKCQHKSQITQQEKDSKFIPVKNIANMIQKILM